MNTYEVQHKDGSYQEVEADCCKRQSEDWAFFQRGTEILRIPQLDVLSIGTGLSRRPAYAFGRWAP